MDNFPSLLGYVDSWQRFRDGGMASRFIGGTGRAPPSTAPGVGYIDRLGFLRPQYLSHHYRCLQINLLMDSVVGTWNIAVMA
jgi:hypothetical protein